MIRKYLVLICLLASVILLIIAALCYPGGSMADHNSTGFQWSKNFMSNLFTAKAMNGADNPGRYWALAGMAFHAVGNGVFFINMSKKIAVRPWAAILKFTGTANILFIILIATPLHDLGVVSIILTLTGLFIITIFILRTKLHALKWCCIVCLLAYYCFFFCYGFGYLGQAVILQKVYVICSMLLVLALEYFTRYEDFIQTIPGGGK